MILKQFFATLIFLFTIHFISFGQGANPHTQQHTLPRGSYVTCVNEMAEKMTISGGQDTSQLNDLLDGISNYELDYIALYGIDRIIDDSITDNPLEEALRYILRKTRTDFPNLEIGVITPSDSVLEAVQTDRFPYSPSEEALCLQMEESLSRRRLEQIMNPKPGAKPNELYHAYVLRFVTRILWYFNGDYSLQGTQGLQQGNNNIPSNGKGNKPNGNVTFSGSTLFPPPPLRKDYFDWVSFEHEYWNAGFIIDMGYKFTDPDVVNIAYDDHKSILIEMRNLLAQNQGCHMEIESYENLMRDNQAVEEPINYPGISWQLAKTMQEQANEVIGLPDRILFTHYFFWPKSYVDRYCEAINAWGSAASGYNTTLWPLFSAEDSTRKSTKFCTAPKDTNKYWGDFLGQWMNPLYTDTIAFGTSTYSMLSNEFPYEVDEFEDEYLRQYYFAESATVTDNSVANGCNCCAIPNSIIVGDYEPTGFMWFFLEFFQSKNVLKYSVAGLTLSFSKNEGLNIYPNPAKELVNVPKHLSFLMMDLQGRLVNPKIVNEQTWNVNHLESGVYFILFTKNNHGDKHVVKLVID